MCLINLVDMYYKLKKIMRGFSNASMQDTEGLICSVNDCNEEELKNLSSQDKESNKLKKTKSSKKKKHGDIVSQRRRDHVEQLKQRVSKRVDELAKEISRKTEAHEQSTNNSDMYGKTHSVINDDLQSCSSDGSSCLDEDVEDKLNQSSHPSSIRVKPIHNWEDDISDDLDAKMTEKERAIIRKLFDHLNLMQWEHLNIQKELDNCMKLSALCKERKEYALHTVTHDADVLGEYNHALQIYGEISNSKGLLNKLFTIKNQVSVDDIERERELAYQKSRKSREVYNALSKEFSEISKQKHDYEEKAKKLSDQIDVLMKRKQIFMGKILLR